MTSTLTDEQVLARTHEIIIYGKKKCDLCVRAKDILASVELPYEFYILAEILGMPDKDDPKREPPENWCEVSDLIALWTYFDNPIPFIVVDGKCFKSVTDALPAVEYAQRRRIVARRNRERDARHDA